VTDFLTINAVPYPVQVGGASENEPILTGEMTRSFSNKARSTRDPLSGKRVWAFTIGPITDAAYNTLVASTRGDLSVNCNGAALGNVNVPCFVEVSSGQYVRDGDAYMRVAAAVVYER
jgi:hypothetical protein